MNPNNPQQNPNSFSETVTPAQASPSLTEIKSGVQNGQEALRTNHVCRSSRQYEDDVKINVPMFGNWETEEHIPYTVYFEKARYKKYGVKMNPNNPQQNPNSFSDNVSPVQVNTFQRETKSWEHNGRVAGRKKLVYSSSSQDDGDLRRPDDSPWYHRTVNLKVAVESLLNRPARSQQRSVTQGAETPGHIAAVTKFGDWDDYIPATADRYTLNKVREERLNRTGNVSASALGKPHYKDLKQHKNGTFKVRWNILLMVSFP
ncbi:RPM1-interacting protein 4 [Citrus sinensis]|uniref:RPM1-interacting protein 4 n=2 Tax=Citrus TaxID=2706 RepID=A0ACB8I1N7_CITSI|nr:RPM1-interacting protein 4 [Citrus sinensis]